MNCPACQHPDSKVLETRAAGDALKRRRQCLQCQHRFTTHERVERKLPLVIKRGGYREPFDRDKIVEGLRLACRKRPVEARVIEEVASRVELRVSLSVASEITSGELGELILAELQEIDIVAYVRFASVLRQVAGPADLLALLSPWLSPAAGAAPEGPAPEGPAIDGNDVAAPLSDAQA